METEAMKEIYNLRSRVVSIAKHTKCSPVSEIQKETAKGKKPGNDEVSKQSKDQEVETAIAKNPEDEPELDCRGPPPMTGRRLRSFLYKKQREKLELSTKALYWYNRDCRRRGLPTYKLVETLGLEGCVLKRGLTRHFNFNARLKDDPCAPLELFFGERVVSWEGLLETRISTSTPD